MATAITRAAYDRLQTRLKNMKAEGEEYARRGIGGTLVVAGGASAGAINAKYPELGSTGVPTAGALGAMLGVLGIFDAFGEYSEQAGCYGFGLLAGESAIRLKEGLSR